jgi:hypothetical protein
MATHLSGGSSYKLHLPANVPAENFWSVTLYDGYNASGLKNGQPFPSIGSLDKLKYNDDGSVDLYFGPELPNGAPESKLFKKQCPVKDGLPCFVSIAQANHFLTRPGDQVTLKK